jgi:hypothetical protein
VSSDFDAVLADEGTEPPDGDHTAYLERAALRDTRNGKAIKIEWRTTDAAFWWESWHNTSGGGKGRTQQLLDMLGIRREALRGGGWDALEDALVNAEGPAYLVRVSHSADGRFLNTEVVARPDAVQPSLNGATAARAPAPPPTLPDVPVDTGDFEPKVAAGGSGDLFGDDDIPF